MLSRVTIFLAAVLAGIVLGGGGGGGGAPEVAIDGVQDLTPANFDEVVGKEAGVLVEFYAPWCGHCKSLVPEYTRLGKAAKANKKVVIAKVDANTHSELGGRFDVKGFPTIKFFPAGSTTAEEYNGGRTAEDFVKFLNEKTGAGLFIPKEVSAVTVLGAHNFDAIALDPTKDVLVEFYAPWCGHCKSLAPVYEKVAATFAGEKDVVIANCNADAAENKGLASKYGVSGFPTIKFFPKTNKAGEEYSEGRDGDAFVNFINKKSGTKRLLGGGFTADAGTDAELNILAQEFVAASASNRAAIKEKIAKRAAAVGADGSEYVKTAAKIDEKGDDWLAKETARVEAMAAGKLTPAKRDSFALRLNVLRAFKQK